MKELIASIRDFGLHEVSMIAGALGAAIAAMRMHGTIIERVGKFTIGFACALWGPGIVINWMSLPQEPQFYGSLGFVFGYFGMTVADALQDTLTTIARHLTLIDWKAIATGWLTRK